MNACRDARPVRPLAKPRIYACILNGADARTVRPYILTSVILIHKIADEAGYSNACRDARLVRPLAKPLIYARILNGTDARTVRPYIPLARKSSCHSPNPKVQYSKFKVQSQQILKFNVQNSMFKVQAPYIAGMAILPRNISRMVLQSEWGYAPNYFVFLSHRPCNWKILAIFVKHSSCECSHEP